MDEQSFGKILKNLRIQKNLTQQELASKGNISLSAVANLETGKGSTLKTFLLYMDTVDKNYVFENLIPKEQESPMQKLRELKKQRLPQRVRKHV